MWLNKLFFVFYLFLFFLGVFLYRFILHRCKDIVMSKFVAASSNVYRLKDVDSHVSVSFFSFTGGRFPLQIITFVMCYLFFVPDTHSLVDLDPRSFRSNVLFSLTTLHFIKVKPKKTAILLLFDFLNVGRKKKNFNIL